MSLIMQALKEETTQIASMTTTAMTRRSIVTEAPAALRAEAGGIRKLHRADEHVLNETYH